ncbi:hypothetical protein [Streptomyces sp. NPDC059862]|uniref:hypothetical protein n=1 Tax=unclassified Streptomyces TaxID=2593676 RepID=UPI0036417D96
MPAGFDSLLGNDHGRLDPTEMIDAMVRIVPSDTSKFCNVVPEFIEKMLKQSQDEAWDITIRVFRPRRSTTGISAETSRNG